MFVWIRSGCLKKPEKLISGGFPIQVILWDHKLASREAEPGGLALSLKPA